MTSAQAADIIPAVTVSGNGNEWPSFLGHIIRAATTQQFIDAWNKRAEAGHGRYLATWLEIESHIRAESQRPEVSPPAGFCAIRNREFSQSPSPSEWIAMARRRDLAGNAFQDAEFDLRRFLAASPFRDARFYGGVKQVSVVEKRIAEYEAGSPLDLWDLIRGRVVAPDLYTVLRLASQFDRWFESRIVRVRNYWLRPRVNPATPYRAIHFEIDTGTGYPCEVQIMTFRRDAVCLIDHSYFIRPSSCLLSQQDVQWMRRFAEGANRLDELEYESVEAKRWTDRCVNLMGLVADCSQGYRT